MAPHQSNSREKLTIRQVPQKVIGGEEHVLSDFGKLVFTPGPFPSSDEINFNDGLEANPYDKIAKVYGRNKDGFLFNSVLKNHETRARILEIAGEKCQGLENSVELLNQFKKRMHVYLKRINSGREDANEALEIAETEGIEAFFHGYHVEQRGIARNIHANLNMNVTTDGQQLETKKILNVRTARMEEEDSRLERLKISGGGKRIMNVVRGNNGQRNYNFSKLAKMELEIKWVSREDKTGMEVDCQLVLEINGGRVEVKMVSINGEEEHGPLTADMLAAIRKFAKQNNEVMVGNKSLSMILEGIESIKTPKEVEEGVATTMVKTLNTASSSKKFDCRSQETLTIVRVKAAKPKSLDNPLENSDFKVLLANIKKLDFTCAGPFDPDDALNYNDGQVDTNPFIKLRKYYGRQKNIFVLIGYLCNDTTRTGIMNVVAEKYGGGEDEESAQKILEFKERIDLFLMRVGVGKQRAVGFLGETETQDVSAFFAGPHHPNENHEKNTCANLNIDLMEKHKGKFPISDFFTRPIPLVNDNDADPSDLDNEKLKRVKFFGNGKKIATASKKDDDGRINYLFTRLAEMELEIEWKASDKIYSEDETGEKETNCAVVLKVGNVDGISLSKASLNGKPVNAADIKELVKLNDKVLIRDKSLYEVVYPEDKKKPKKGTGENEDDESKDKEGFISLDD